MIDLISFVLITVKVFALNLYFEFDSILMQFNLLSNFLLITRLDFQNLDFYQI
jgi:hypothetical protein